MVAASSASRIPESPPPLSVEHREPGASARLEGAALAEHHGEYLEARAVYEGSPGRAMFWTARRPSQIPPAFSTRQRRSGSSLIAEFLSPDRVTRGWQMRTDRQLRNREGRTVKWMSPPGDRARIVLGVVPEMLDEVRSGTGPLWSVEGLTRAAALAPYGIPAVSYAGCWNWQKDGEPLSCWDHVNLSGRLVLVCMDGDWRTNENVQKALEAHVAMLEGRGARVLVVNVEEGLDDALASGSPPAALARNARPFEPVDVRRERLSKDEKLAALAGACWRQLEEIPANSRAACSMRAAMRDLIGTGERTGTPTPEGLLVIRSSIDGAVGSRMSERAWWKAIGNLKKAGALQRAKWGPKKDRPGAYLLTPWGGGSAERAHYRGEGPQEEGREREGREKREERARSFPLSKADCNRGVHETRAPENLRKPEKTVPALRWPKVVHTWGRRNGRRVVVDSDYIARIGKQGEEIIRYLLEHGSVGARELLHEFGSKTARTRDFVRRRIRPLEEWEIVARDGESVYLTPTWREALERERELREELRDNRLQAEKAERRKRERREHFARVRRGESPKADPAPRREDLMGKERVRGIVRERRREAERANIEEQRRKVGMTCEVFVHDALAGIPSGRIRFGLLREMWADKGGKRDHVRFAIKKLGYTLERFPEHPGELFVVRREAPRQSHASEARDPAPVTPLRSEHRGEHKSAELRHIRHPEKEPRKVDGIYVHPPDCGCGHWLCEDEPSYAGAPA